MDGAQISVDTQQVSALADAVGRAQAEARAVLRAPHLLNASLSAMTPGGPAGPHGLGGLGVAGAAFLDAWQQALHDATSELERLGAALATAAEVYATTERVSAARYAAITVPVATS